MSEATIDDRLEPFLASPESAAIVSDVDGTLAPIVERPQDARVPAKVRALLERLAAGYGLVACVSGRQALDARALVGVDGITYIGNHGLERLDPGSDVAVPLLGGDMDEAGGPSVSFALDRVELGASGLRLENKGLITALHWRGAPDEARAEEQAEALAAAAEREGLRVHRGRKVLEIRPDVEFDKGAAITTLLADEPVSAALYAGDDRTDLDAFRALDSLRASGGLEAAVNVGIATPESPPEIASAADIVVDDPPGFWSLLDRLA